MEFDFIICDHHVPDDVLPPAVAILNVLTKLPVINGINKIAGAAVGGIKCIIFIWIAFLVLTLLCNTTLGQQGMALIQQDAFLNFLYSQNVFVKVFMSVFYGN